MPRIGNPLYEAVVDKSLPKVAELLAGGADANGNDPSGERPLHAAARWAQPEIARLLLEAGADVDAVDRNGNTPLWRAVFDYSDENHEPGARVLEILLKHGADLNKKNRHGMSPRSVAANNVSVKPVLKEAIARAAGPAPLKKTSKKASRKA
jgi:ankyrin repeat protein